MIFWATVSLELKFAIISGMCTNILMGSYRVSQNKISQCENYDIYEYIMHYSNVDERPNLALSSVVCQHARHSSFQALHSLWGEVCYTGTACC